jgi:hypothetical protein
MECDPDVQRPQTATDSTSAGYITPSIDVTLSDDGLADALWRMGVGITGLPENMVRPRFQPDPPDMPENDQDWCAIGVTDVDPPGSRPELIHDDKADGGKGATLMRGYETMSVMASFYGPNAMGYATRLRDGLQMAQNRDEMQADGSLNLLWVGTIRNVSDNQNTTFRNRFDLTIRLRHRFERTYNVRNIVEIQGTISADGGSLDGSTSHDHPFSVKG